MKKSDIILKKASMFEKLSRCENKQAMLKVFAKDTTTSLISAVNQEIAKLTNTGLPAHNIPYLNDDASKSDILETINNALDFSIDNKVYDNNDYLLRLRDKANTLTEDLLKERSYLALERPTTSYETDGTSKNIKDSVPGIAKYYSIVQNGERLLNTMGILDAQIDYKKLLQYETPFNLLIINLLSFNQSFPNAGSRQGELQTMSLRVNNLLSQEDKYRSKLQIAREKSNSNPTV